MITVQMSDSMFDEEVPRYNIFRSNFKKPKSIFPIITPSTDDRNGF